MIKFLSAITHLFLGSEIKFLPSDLIHRHGLYIYGILFCHRNRWIDIRLRMIDRLYIIQRMKIILIDLMFNFDILLDKLWDILLSSRSSIRCNRMTIDRVIGEWFVIEIRWWPIRIFILFFIHLLNITVNVALIIKKDLQIIPEIWHERCRER